MPDTVQDLTKKLLRAIDSEGNVSLVEQFWGHLLLAERFPGSVYKYSLAAAIFVFSPIKVKDMGAIKEVVSCLEQAQVTAEDLKV